MLYSMMVLNLNYNVSIVIYLSSFYCIKVLKSCSFLLPIGLDSNHEDLNSFHGNFNEHDEDTLECLAVTFPPYYFSTVGLDRPATPDEEHRPRYLFMVEK